MTAEAQAVSASIESGRFDPFRGIWRLLTNVKFALLLVGSAAGCGLLAVVIPQVPGPMRSNPPAKAAWLELQRGDFGAFTGPLDRFGFFDVYHSWWFNGLWLLIVVAVTVCTVSRFQPTWRAVRQPPKRVNDLYFATAHHRANFTHPGGVEAVEAQLRRRRYRVERVEETPEATYLFAARFSWSHYGTFLSHLALLMLLIGALLTKLAGFDRTLALAEGTAAAPVFDGPGPGQIFVGMVDAVQGRDTAANVVDFHSDLEVRRGDTVITCRTTVNDPCSAFGYRFHQAAFFDDIARLRVTAPDGRLLYDDVLDFNNQKTIVPLMRVTDGSGTTLFGQALPQMGTDPGDQAGPADDLAVAALAIPRAPGASAVASFAVAWRVVDGTLRVAVSGEGLAPRNLRPGEMFVAGDYRLEYQGPAVIPAIRVGDMPGGDAHAGVTVQMPTDSLGNPYLFVSGVDEENVVLQVGQPVRTASGHTYSFTGRVEASGVNVRRDPGGRFIWVAVGMALVGLGITFYVPRRRLWVKVTAGRSYLAGLAERTTRLSRELRLLGAELGSRDALLPGDTDRE